LSFFENSLDTLLLFPVTFLLQLSIVVYAVFPDLIAWAQISLPVWSRWIGVTLGIGALSLLAWADRELGKNFSMTLRIREDHTLITTGPYRWIRHPIYSVGLHCLLTCRGSNLDSANSWAFVSKRPLTVPST
jgi:protein-S-isoprenylcysteine O-methyltransferase Ste14